MNTITVHANSSGRAAYRVVPDPDDPAILQIEGTLVRVLDISASGFSCPAGEIAEGRRYRFQLDLPGRTQPLSGYVDVLPALDNGQLHCQFVELDAEDLDTLHRYVLLRQIDVIRSMRAGSTHR